MGLVLGDEPAGRPFAVEQAVPLQLSECPLHRVRVYPECQRQLPHGRDPFSRPPFSRDDHPLDFFNELEINRHVCVVNRLLQTAAPSLLY